MNYQCLCELPMWVEVYPEVYFQLQDR